MAKPRVVVFYGGEMANADLSMQSGLWVCECIPRSTYDVTPVEVTADGKWKVPLGTLPRSGAVSTTLQRLSQATRALPPAQALERLVQRPIEALLTLLRGKGGDDGSVHAIASLLGVPVVGSSQRAFQQASDKHLFGQVVSDVAATPYSRRFTRKIPLDSVVDEIREDFLPPLFLKPASAEGSFGTEYIESLDDLRSSVSKILAFDDLLVQERIAGPELSVSITQDARGNVVALPPTVVKQEKAPFYTRLAKRRPGLVSLHSASNRDDAVIEEAEEIARDIYDDFDYTGLVTLDMIAGDEGIHVLEANMVPTLTAHTPLRHQLKSGGMHPTNLLDALIRNTLG